MVQTQAPKSSTHAARGNAADLPDRLRSVAEHLKPATSMKDLDRALKACRACPLWRDATQAVPGEGDIEAPLLALVGEQPGDQEDLAGKPFVGPAGKLLDRALGEAGIARSTVYVTNVVKPFKWEPARKRRSHKNANVGQISACRPFVPNQARPR